ncbi:TraU family protein [Alcaligenes faecalis]|uniref:TraU family protein n=1 Tax=Alcaligenes TaxID=507 RepID=UPI002180AA4D|nr:TraU family protein [Alcaligenes faecalis]
MSITTLRFRHMLAISLLVLATALRPVPATAATTTAGVVTNTVAALPSCTSYQVKGICVWLVCVPLIGCFIRTSVRVAHYVPDVVISTYNDPLAHPWAEVGKPLATAISSVGSAVVGAPIDASAGTQREGTEVTTYKSADAIGNPAGLIASIASGYIPSFGSSFQFPGYSELLAFTRTELPRITQSWRQVPQQLGNEFIEAARAMANAPADIISSVSAFPAKLGELSSSIGNLSNVFGGSVSTQVIGLSGVDMVGADLGPIRDMVQIAQRLGASGGLSEMFCPGSASAFNLHFQSDMDAMSWRGFWPLEMLYPQSWVPGTGEVSTSPLSTTWGPIYPRNGELVQSHPVKASAVLATRVGSIISQSAQPHIYKRLQPGSGYKYFPTSKPTTWQMIYPSAQRSCMTFGADDSLSLASFGDYKTDGADGYMWNMWNHYDCCRIRGEFLYSIP